MLWRWHLAAAICVLGLPAWWGQSAPPPPRYDRAIDLQATEAGEDGTRCLVLDAEALSQGARRLGDTPGAKPALQIIAVNTADPRRPVERTMPFTLTESGVEQEEPTLIPATERHASPGGARFQLRMPQRAYSAIDLRLALHEFTGQAVVWGLPAERSTRRVPLGTFSIFDLSAQGLGRSMRLALAESRLPVLEIDLTLWDAAHRRPLPIPIAALEGAEVPPSREAETLYTTVATARGFAGQNGLLQATTTLPAGVPVERLSVELNPRFPRSFLVPVEAIAQAGAAIERVAGDVTQVTLPGGSVFRRLEFPAALGVNQAQAAQVQVRLGGVGAAALPAGAVQAVRLEMRRREICFAAQPGERYRLRYGGPPHNQRRGDWLWVALLGILTLLGARLRERTLVARQ